MIPFADVSFTDHMILTSNLSIPCPATVLTVNAGRIKGHAKVSNLFIFKNETGLEERREEKLVDM